MGKKRKKHQYVVIGKYGALQLEAAAAGGDEPKGGCLYIADLLTVFASRRAAQKAIDRSAQYADLKGFDWDTDEHRIVRLTPPARD